MKGTHVRTTRNNGYKGATGRLTSITIDGNRVDQSKRQVSILAQPTIAGVPQTKEGPNLSENGHFILSSQPKIDELIQDFLDYNNEVITDKVIEIEARLLSPNTNKVADKFRRIRDWLLNKFQAAEIPIEENTFQEIDSTVSTAQMVDKSHNIQYVTRNGVTYMKIKKTFKGSTGRGGEYIILPNIMEIQPRLGVSLESHMKINDLSSIETQSTTRNRTRWTFPIHSPKIYLSLRSFENMGIDIPKISAQNVRGRIDITRSETVGNLFIDYSVEIELESTDENGEEILFDKINREQMDFLDGWIKILAIVMNRSGSLLTTGESEAISYKFNTILTESGNFIPQSIVNKPKDLQKHDLAWLKPQESDFFMQLNDYDNNYDQIITTFATKRVFLPLMSIDGGYYCALKADGNRYFLFMDTTGFYLINPLASIMTKISGDKTPFSDPKYFSEVNGNILDCELVLDEKYMEGFNTSGVSPQYNILVFDILASDGKDVRDVSYTKRLELINDVIKKFYSQLNSQSISSFLNIANKNVVKLPSIVRPRVLINQNQFNIERLKVAQEFFSALSEEILLNRISSTEKGLQETTCLNGKKFKWRTDGLIFTPAERPYLETRDTFYQDFGNTDEPNYSLVRKWKEVLTIDFLVRRNGSNVITIMSYSRRQRDVPFNGKKGTPWNGNVELDNSMLERIFEFRWGFSERFLDYAFIPVRERTDRDNANSIRTARDVWSLINDPIRIEDLTGETLSLMRRYHNKVKASLLSLLVSKFENPCLFDIGSGRFGDISKWSLFDIVYAVEPDEKNLREGLSRLEERSRFNSAIVSETETIITKEAAELAKQKENLMKINISDQQSQEEIAITKDSLLVHYSRVSTLLSRSILKTIKTESNTNVVIKRLMAKGTNNRRTGSEKPKQERVHIIPINTQAENINYLLENIPIGVINCCTMFNALTFFYESREKLQLMIDTVKTFLTQGGYFSVVALDGELLLNSMQTSSSSQTEEIPTYNTIKTKNITISKAPDPSCRKIFIKIEGGIVRGQYEYLIQLREFVQIMNDNGFKLLDERYLNEETLLSEEEYWFSSMFKLLQFRYSIPTLEQEVRIAAQNNPEINLIKLKEKIEIENFGKRIIEKMEGDRALRPLSSTEDPQELKSTKFVSAGNLVRIGVPRDGSCYVHGILRAFYKDYKETTVAARQDIVTQVRKDMSANYTREIHDAIGDGFFKTSQYPAYSYENIKTAISDNTYWIDQQLMGFIGDQLQTNVYIMRGIDPDIYHFGNANSHIKPGRKNIVLYWLNENHYEVVGVLEENNIVRTVFPDNHPLIQIFKNGDDGETEGE